MEQVVSSIIEKQNKELLRLISIKYKLDYEELVRMYSTPSFYHISKKNK